MKYKKGQSGNPTGRPKGAKDRRTELRELFQPHAKNLIDRAVRLALRGDPAALRLCIERLVSPIKASSEPFRSEIKLSGSLSEQAGQIVKGMAAGTIDPDAGKALIGVIQTQGRIIEFSELEKRISTLEKIQAGTCEGMTDAELEAIAGGTTDAELEAIAKGTDYEQTP